MPGNEVADKLAKLGSSGVSGAWTNLTELPKFSAPQPESAGPDAGHGIATGCEQCARVLQGMLATANPRRRPPRKARVRSRETSGSRYNLRSQKAAKDQAASARASERHPKPALAAPRGQPAQPGEGRASKRARHHPECSWGYESDQDWEASEPSDLNEPSAPQEVWPAPSLRQTPPLEPWPATGGTATSSFSFSPVSQDTLGANVPAVAAVAPTLATRPPPLSSSAAACPPPPPSCVTSDDGTPPAVPASLCWARSPRPYVPPQGESGGMDGAGLVSEETPLPDYAGPPSAIEGPPYSSAASATGSARGISLSPTAPPSADLLAVLPGASAKTVPPPPLSPPDLPSSSTLAWRPPSLTPAFVGAVSPAALADICESLSPRPDAYPPGRLGGTEGPRPVSHKSLLLAADGPISGTEGPSDVAAAAEFDLVCGAPPSPSAPPASAFSGTPPVSSAGTNPPSLSRPPTSRGGYADAALGTDSPLGAAPAVDDALAPLSPAKVGGQLAATANADRHPSFPAPPSRREGTDDRKGKPLSPLGDLRTMLPRSLDSQFKLAPHYSQSASPPLGPQGPLDSDSPGQAARESVRPRTRRPSSRKRKRREVKARPAKRPMTSQPRDRASKKNRKRKLRPTSAEKNYPIFSRQKRPRTNPPRTNNANLQKQAAPQGTECVGANFPT